MEFYSCERCLNWQEKREELLYKIITTSAMAPELLDDVKKFDNGIMPMNSKNFRLIDFLIIAEAWNKLSKILLSSCRDVDTIIDHLRVVERIPINCQSKIALLGDVIKQNLISATEVLPNFEDLMKYKVKDILDDNGEIDEENIEHNEDALAKLKEACSGLDPEKISKSPGLKILTKNIECIDTLNLIIKFYDKSYSGAREFKEYEELFEKLKTTTYSGELLARMEQEIADYQKFKEDAEYILNEENNQD